jgi:hypothetical protein
MTANIGKFNTHEYRNLMTLKHLQKLFEVQLIDYY